MFKSIMKRVNLGAKKEWFIVTAYRKDGSFKEFRIQEVNRQHAIQAVRSANKHVIFDKFSVEVA